MLKVWKHKNCKTQSIQEYRKVYRKSHLEYFREYGKMFRRKNPDYYRKYRRQKHIEKYGVLCPKLYTSKFESTWGCLLVKYLPNFVFVKVRPSWLRNNETGRNLELDFYCDALKLGIEVSGNQHFYFTPFFHRGGIQDFIAQQKRDELKMKLCEKFGVTLIVITRKSTVDQVFQQIFSKILSSTIK